MGKIRILIADDHMLFRQGIKELLKDNRFVEVIGEAEDGNQLYEEYFTKKPDLLLIDIAMPQMSGYEAFEKIKETDNRVKALFLSMHTEEIYYYQIYKAGGYGLINKNIFLEELEKAVSSIRNGGKYFGAKYPVERLEMLVRERNKKYSVKNQRVRLSEREEEVLRLITEGFSSRDIAKKLLISKRTIDKHRESIMQKANLKNLMSFYKFAEDYIKNT